MGDKLQFSSFPENYHRNTGDKVIDLDNVWIFDHNPFVVRGEAPTSIVNLWTQPWPQKTGLVTPAQFVARPIFFSIADRTACIFNQIAYLRHPRLYIHEDLPILEKRVVIHTTGKLSAGIRRAYGEDRARVFSEEIIDHIRRKYRSYDVSPSRR